MPFQLSPGVLVKEIDLTNIVPAVATSIGGMAGAFQKGPVDEIVAIGSEKELVDIFGKPNGSNFETWFTAANFLQYGNALRVVRASSAIVNATSGGSGILIKSTDDYLNNFAAGQGSSGEWGARTAGTHGNSLGVSLCSNATAYEQTFAGNAGTAGVTTGTPAVGATTVGIDNGGGSAGAGGAKFNVGDIVHFQEADGQEYEVTAISTDNLTIKQLDNPNGGGLKTALAAATNVRRRWRFYDLFDAAPGTSTYATGKGLIADEMHVVVFDRTGDISGFRADTNGERTNAVLETFPFVSQAASAKTSQGGTNFYPDVIYGQSKFIYWLDHDGSLSNAGTDPAAGTTFASTAGKGGVKDDNLAGGTDDYAVTVGELALAYDNFADAETVDINLLMAGTSPASADGVSHATKMIDICEARKDCVAFISPRRADVVNVSSAHTQGSNVVGFFNSLASSSYAVFDSGYKYMYDKFNDTFRYVPLNGDIAGLCANTDNVADPFFSPGGFNRGQIRGAVKLAFNPTKAQRDILYPARINPVVTFPGQGTVLFGDKTALSKPSAFDRINVRRLFILLEKSIATAAKFQLFEFNDEFTQAQFRNLVEPFLRDIQGRRGITDFSVVCDGTNNTGEVIDRNEFVADIFIKPARSINFIQLNFIAVRTGVAFSEVGG
jgi:phage tail sheath protein FI